MRQNKTERLAGVWGSGAGSWVWMLDDFKVPSKPSTLIPWFSAAVLQQWLDFRCPDCGLEVDKNISDSSSSAVPGSGDRSLSLMRKQRDTTTWIVLKNAMSSDPDALGSVDVSVVFLMDKFSRLPTGYWKSQTNVRSSSRALGEVWRQ